MVTLSVLYPKTADSHFDLDYYLATHIPLVKSTWTPLGLVSVTLFEGTGMLDGSAAPFSMIGHLTFKDEAAVQAALAAGSEVLADIPKFCSVGPVIEVCKPVV